MTVVGEQLQPTLFERSRPGRGGGKIPHPPKDALDRHPGGRPAGDAAGPARAQRARGRPPLRQPVAAELRDRHRVLSARLVHDEVQPEAQRVGGPPARASPTLHPLAPDEVAQGTLQLLWELEQALAEISGMRAVTLQPAAGAQGELTGILMIRAYHRSRGDTERDEVLVPDSSHGTNPATASMAGFRTITIPSAADGGVDVDAFRAALGPRTAAVMITNPSTLGLFEKRIGELLDAVHEAGALAYMDGANLNAILGRFKPGEAGFDVMHFNVHKTFSTPHGGGGPGAGPVGVGETLLPFLPRAAGPPRRRRHVPPRAARRATDLDRPAAQLRRQHRRPRPRLRLHPGPRRRPACAEVSDDAVLAANYLRKRVGEAYDIPFDRACKHEFVASAAGDQEADRRPDARHRQAADRLRLPPADDLLPADGRGGDADRADRDRVGRDARRLRRRPDRDRPRGGDRPGAGHERAARRRRSAGSTRRPPPASRTCAGAP